MPPAVAPLPLSSGPPPTYKDPPTIPVPARDPYDPDPAEMRPLRNSKGRPIAPNGDYDHDVFPFGPPSVGKYIPHNPNQKYRLLIGQYVGEDGIQYTAGVHGRDIVPESTKHPEGLARWPEKFQPLMDDAYSRAVRGEETIEELEARLAILRANQNGLKELTPEQVASKMATENPPSGASTLDTMTLEELQVVAQEEEINLQGAKTKEQILARIKKIQGK